MAAGTLVKYVRTDDLETMQIVGPTTNDLHVMVSVWKLSLWSLYTWVRFLRRVIRKILKVVLTPSLLGTQHGRNGDDDEPANALVPLKKALNNILCAFAANKGRGRAIYPSWWLNLTRLANKARL